MFNGFHRWYMALVLPALLIAFTAAAAPAYEQVVDGVAIYFGIVPAELVRGHPRQHPEGEMHGGPHAGQNHVMVALFDDKSGRRITVAEVHASVTGPKGLRSGQALEPMVIANAVTFGNYFAMPGPGPYRIALRIRLPGTTRDIEAVFSWARS
jgi:hypothetical protein